MSHQDNDPEQDQEEERIRNMLDDDMQHLSSSPGGRSDLSSRMSNKSEKNMADFDGEILRPDIMMDTEQDDPDLPNLLLLDDNDDNNGDNKMATTPTGSDQNNGHQQRKHHHSNSNNNNNEDKGSEKGFKTNYVTPTSSQPNTTTLLLPPRAMRTFFRRRKNLQQQQQQGGGLNSEMSNYNFQLENVCSPGQTLLWDLIQDDKIVS